MGMTIDDDVKQKLLDSLAEEPTMVISTAYAYAKNYVMYGEDITKEWTTVVQQVSILEKVREKAWVEAYDSFKKDYETRLKADLKAILVELQLQMEEYEPKWVENDEQAVASCRTWEDLDGIIQNKINSLKGESENT